MQAVQKLNIDKNWNTVVVFENYSAHSYEFLSIE